MEAEQECRITTAIAINNDKNSQGAVKWAVENLLSSANHCILVHVKTLQTQTYDLNGVPRRGLPPTENEVKQLFLPFRGFCARKGIDAKEVILHDLNVANALIDYINNSSISNIVVGASNRSPLTRKFRPPDVPASLNKSAPDFCSLYVIGKGKVQQVRPASRNVQPQKVSMPSKSPLVKASPRLPSNNSDCRTLTRTCSQRSWRSVSSNRYFDNRRDSMQASPYQLFTVGSKNSSPPTSMENLDYPCKAQYWDSSPDVSFTGPLSFRSSGTLSDNSEFSSSSGHSRSYASSVPSTELEAEMRRLKLELKQTKELYNSACKEAATAKQRERQLQQRKRVEMKEEDVEEHVREKAASTRSIVRYRQYSLEDIEVATDYFSVSLKIGEGGYGPVYKAFLDHTPVAIKVLRSDVSQGRKQFDQEVEILSCMRHPHMVLLLGACPEHGCLVYEYMENGSLEDRLFRENNTAPIPWQSRFRIATEIATSLLFLHQAKPEPLVHRDLKPANILLDRNYVSKISDVGLARLVPPSIADTVTRYHMTAAAGTFCYIDPEYQQTGMLGVKSDIYSLGVMLLQIITAMPPMGLAHKVERAIESGTFGEILDQTVSDWPIEAALSFAKLALKCCELRKKDRPDLGSVVLPELQCLRDLGMDKGTIFQGRHSRPL